MSKFDKGLIVFTVLNITLCAWLLMPHQPAYTPKAQAAPTPTCPAGSYDIGIEKDGSLICKLEPTGCPYGDSIPLDSPKCAPPESPTAYDPYVPAPEYVEPVELMQGK